MSNNKKSKWQQRREVKQHTARVVKQHLEGREVLQRQLTKLIEEGTTPAPTTRMTKHTVNVTLDAYRTYLEKPSEENYLRFENFKKISDGMLSDEAKQKLNALLLSHQIRFNDKVSVQDNAIRMRCAMKDNLGTQITKLISDYPEIQASIKIQKLINDSTQTLRQSLRHSGKRPSAQDYQKTRDAINSAMRVYRVDIESMNRMNKYLDEFHGSIRAESAAKKAINKNITYFPGEKAVAFKSVSDANDFRQDRQKIANMSGLSNAEITVNVKADKTIRPKAKPKSKTEKVESTIPRKRTVKEAITKSKPIKAAKRVVAKATKPNVKLEKQKEARKPRKTARKSTGIFAMSPDENNRKRFDTQAAPTIQAPAAPPNRTNKPSISANSNIEKAITNANDIMVSTIRMEREARKLPAQEKIEKLNLVLKKYDDCIQILETANSENNKLMKMDLNNETLMLNKSRIDNAIQFLRDKAPKISDLVAHNQSMQPHKTEQKNQTNSTSLKRGTLFSHETRLSQPINELINHDETTNSPKKK